MVHTNPFPIPTRWEKRGEFPKHEDRPGRRVLTAAQARLLALHRLAKWRRVHG